MDLYEALLSGVSREELIDKFFTELGAAEVQVKKDEEKQQNEQYDAFREARETFLCAFIDYLALLEGPSADEDKLNAYVDSLEDALIAIEKLISHLS